MPVKSKTVPNYQRVIALAEKTLPSSYDLNQAIIHLHDKAYELQMIEQSAQFDEFVRLNYQENMSFDHYRETLLAMKNIEFCNAQSRKSRAGSIYEHIVKNELEKRGLLIVKTAGSTIDRLVVSSHGDAVASLSMKRTCRERWSQEGKYARFAQSGGFPQYLVTYDTSLSQTLVDEITGSGLNLALRDEIVGAYKASPHVLPVSKLPNRLHALTQRLRLAA
jgi:hypothetical protein